MPNLYIISGCNGAGKTTASLTILPEILQCKEFVNADSIASGLSPFNPESVAFEAGRLMLQRLQQLLKDGVDFAFETTLASKNYIQLIASAKQFGYTVTLLFFWLSSPELAKQRVASRVAKGGHNIPEDVIERRYYRGIYNFINLYIPVCDVWILIDNNESTSVVVSRGQSNVNKETIKPDVWETILNQIKSNDK